MDSIQIFLCEFCKISEHHFSATTLVNGCFYNQVFEFSNLWCATLGIVDILNYLFLENTSKCHKDNVKVSKEMFHNAQKIYNLFPCYHCFETLLSFSDSNVVFPEKYFVRTFRKVLLYLLSN